jgi:hypothetical protein
MYQKVGNFGLFYGDDICADGSEASELFEFDRSCGPMWLAVMRVENITYLTGYVRKTIADSASIVVDLTHHFAEAMCRFEVPSLCLLVSQA